MTQNNKKQKPVKCTGLALKVFFFKVILYGGTLCFSQARTWPEFFLVLTAPRFRNYK